MIKVAPIQASLRKRRREVGARSPTAFARLYLGAHFRLPESRMHAEVTAMLVAASARRNQRLAIAAPRGHAKTTLVCLAYVLWCVLYHKEPFILIVSETKEQAMQRLADLKREIQTNELLLADFPELCRPPGARPAPKPWKEHQIMLPNGVAIRVLGSGQAIRGIKHGAHRPSLIVVDDLEGQAQIDSAEQREKLGEWFERSLLKAGGPGTNVVVIGTIVHYASLLARLILPVPGQSTGAGWVARRYQAVESFSARSDLWDRWENVYTCDKEWEGRTGPEAAMAYFTAKQGEMLTDTKVLWPEREDYLQLMVMRAAEGRRSFQAEKQNEPLDPEQCLFAQSKFRFWDDEFASADDLIQSMRGRVEIYGACDPSLGQKGNRGDYSAIVTVVKDSRTNRFYVIGAEVARRKPSQIIERIIALGRARRYLEFVVEDNQFQVLLADDLERRAREAGVHVPVRRRTSTGKKQTRIESLEPLIAQGILVFSRQHRQLLEQLQLFPLGTHDDGPDALEMAVSAAMTGGGEAGRVYIPNW